MMWNSKIASPLARQDLVVLAGIEGTPAPSCLQIHYKLGSRLHLLLGRLTGNTEKYILHLSLRENDLCPLRIKCYLNLAHWKDFGNNNVMCLLVCVLQLRKAKHMPKCCWCEEFFTNLANLHLSRIFLLMSICENVARCFPEKLPLPCWVFPPFHSY